MSDQTLEKSKTARASQDREDFVAVMFAHNRREAELCRSLLTNHGITAELEPGGSRMRRLAGISVLVPSEKLIEASDIVASSDFYRDATDADRPLVKSGPQDDDDDFVEDEDEDEFEDEEEFDDDEEEEEDDEDEEEKEEEEEDEEEEEEEDEEEEEEEDDFDDEDEYDDDDEEEDDEDEFDDED